MEKEKTYGPFLMDIRNFNLHSFNLKRLMENISFMYNNSFGVTFLVFQPILIKY